jgi:hypothetical protein
MQRGQQTFGKKSRGVLYGQKPRTPHLMRISLIIVGRQPAQAEKDHEEDNQKWLISFTRLSRGK